MIVVKLTILLTIVVLFLAYMFKGWCLHHPIKATTQEYPWWSYIMSVLIILDVIGIFASAVWLLFFW